MAMEIGGDIEIPLSHLWWPKLGQHKGFIPEGWSYLPMSNGRAAIRLVLREILKLGQGDEVLLPAYVFDGLLNPFRESGMTIRFYKVSGNLTLDAEDIKRKMSQKTKLLFILHCFGFPQPVHKLEWLREEYPGCSVIEDITQSLGTARLDSSLGRFGDFTFSVYMKYVPIADGALLLMNKPNDYLNWKRGQFQHFLYAGARYAAMNLKNLGHKTHLIPKVLYLWLFGYAARLQEGYPLFARMSWVSRRLLDRFDYDDIIRKRRQNYQYLLDNWRSDVLKPLYPSLPANICPMGFVVVSENRDRFRKVLARSGIFCPVHWPPVGDEGVMLSPAIDKQEFPVSWEISNSIMMIFTDQRYGKKEMDYILDQVDKLKA